MGAVPRQQYLDLNDTGEHFRILHARHQHDIAVCTKDLAGLWINKVYSHDVAGTMLVSLAPCDDLDVYLGRNGFAGRRTHECLRVLNAVYIDLDTYNVGLEGVQADDLLDQVLERYPWLPVPTLLFNSGRGVYFEWIFTKPLSPQDHLSEWQAVTDALITVLAPFGADPACRDAGRVLRAVGSTNQKSHKVVTGLRVGPAVNFESFARIVLANAVQTTVKAPAKPVFDLVSNPDFVPVASTASPARRQQYIRPYKLAYDRMTDCEKLAELRGSPRMSDCRHRLLYVYAVSGAWYWSGRDQSEQELRYFAERHFAEPARYRARRVGTVLKRMQERKSGLVRIANGFRVDPRYKLRNSTIISLLEITASEQRQLRTIISAGEGRRRLTERRRTAGMVSRDDYLDRAAERRQKALEMHQAGLSHKVIAAELGVTRQAVGYMLKQG